MSRYSFSGHESFVCKGLWLKKGYDYLVAGGSFTSSEAPWRLGVGKNMVGAIRHYLRAFALTEADRPTKLADYLLADSGRDPFLEDEATLWLLHYEIVSSGRASIYGLLFGDFLSVHRQFDREAVRRHIEVLCQATEQKGVYNDTTVRRDIGVLLRSYALPDAERGVEEYGGLLLPLGLLRRGRAAAAFEAVNGNEAAHEQFYVVEIEPLRLPDAVLLYALNEARGQDNTIALTEVRFVANAFCIPLPAFIAHLRGLCQRHNDLLAYEATAGVVNIVFRSQLTGVELLKCLHHDAA